MGVTERLFPHPWYSGGVTLSSPRHKFSGKHKWLSDRKSPQKLQVWMPERGRGQAGEGKKWPHIPAASWLRVYCVVLY
ncbi:hypothetical protein E2C01_035455 [Portunus trituberculatus]|uniref:Uncharacterized protein n=1 Tax=Portunus trituberculatus TaxID=210409 RepID=A0A5B7F9T5_PORTR|nr:hypothetical protein [Portunus trituberculatus]